MEPAGSVLLLTRGFRTVSLSVAVALLAIAVSCTAEESDPTPAASPTPALAPTLTPTPAAIAPGSAPAPEAGRRPAIVRVDSSDSLAIEVVDGAFERIEVPPGGEAPLTHGIYFLALDSVVEGWSLTGVNETQELGPRYRYSPDGRWVTADRTVGFYVLDRDSGRELTWRGDVLRPLGEPTAAGLIALLDGVGRIHVVDLAADAIRPIASFELSMMVSRRDGGMLHPFSLAPAARAEFAPDGSVLVVLARDDEAVHLFRIDLDAPAEQHIASLPLDDGGAQPRWVTIEARADEFVLFARYRTRASRGEGSDTYLLLERYGWAGGRVMSERIATGDAAALTNGPYPDHALLSPHGSYLAWEETLPYAQNEGLGGHEDWPVVVIADAHTGERLLRVHRVSLNEWTVPLGWFADGCCVAVTLPDGYGHVTPIGHAVQPLRAGDRGQYPDRLIPSATNPNLFGFGHKIVRSDGSMVAEARFEGRSGSRVRIEPRGWTSVVGEYVLVGYLTNGFGLAPSGVSSFALPPRIELPPFDDTIRLVAAPADRGCAELRAEATLEAPMRACVAEGTELVLTNAAVGPDTRSDCNGHSARLCASTYDLDDWPSERRWIHVESAAGERGWIQPRDVAWEE